MSKFTIAKHDQSDKDFSVEGGDSLYMRVDYDDVDHKTVDKEIKKMVDILNKYWNGEPKEDRKFTIEEIRNYINAQDSLGDVAYYLKEENIIKANQPKEDENETEE